MLPARSECLLPVSLPRYFTERLSGAGTAATVIVEPFIAPNRLAKFLVARTLQNCKKQDRRTFCRVLKFNDEDCSLRKGTPVAIITQAELLSQNEIVHVRKAHEDVDKSQEKKLCLEEKIKVLQEMGLNVEKTELNAEVYIDFCDLLYSYKDIFATKLSDLTEGSHVIECPILTYPDAKPVRMRPYRLNDSMRAVVDKQLDELLEAGIIKESQGSQWASFFN